MSPGKRKHHAREEESASAIKLRKLETESNANGPVLVTFPGIVPPDNTVFKCYKRSTSKTKTEQRIIAGETDKIEFVGGNFGEYAVSEVNSRYVVGMLDRKSNTLTFMEAPLFPLTRTVKALKNLNSQVDSQTEFMRAKNALGEAFGTKKTKQMIKSYERNRVNMEVLNRDAEVIQSAVEERTSSMPTREEVQAEANSERPIPPPNVKAERPEDVYKLSDIVTVAEMNAIPLKKYLEAGSADEFCQMLPFKTSKYIRERLITLFSAEKKNHKELRLLVYLSYMMAFHFIDGIKIGKKENAINALDKPPTVILDQLYRRYTEAPALGARIKKPRKTPISKDRLLCYAFALCLHIDNFDTDPHVLAADFALKPSRTIELFKSLGCRIEKLTETQKIQLGVDNAEAKNMRRAVLKPPISFPEPRRARKKQ
ncbi:uncharacterized protein VTP21DRAFT_1873 [Calcarisporiella thermophila]|uniref:uncharacterized protein n=1 Tax=Calcarisporiella thermophila TaxID=911321 RepID=UPI003743AB57